MADATPAPDAPPEPRRSWVRPDRIAGLLAMPAAACALAPWGAGWHWTVDLLACFPVQAAGWLLLSAFTFLLLRKWGLAAAAAIGAGFAVAAVVPGWTGAPPAPNKSPGDVENAPRLHVLSLNLLRSNHVGRAELLEVVREVAPDAIWCTEYTPEWQRFLRAELADFPHRLEHADSGHFGGAVFARHPLAPAEFLVLGEGGTAAARAVLHHPSGPIGILGVHPPPPGLSGARVAGRDRGLAGIERLAEGLPARRIVLGDFNATPWNAAFRTMRADNDLGPGTTAWWLPTWPAQWPLPLRIPIDHVLVAGDLRVVDARVGASFGSDHLPLAATIAVGR